MWLLAAIGELTEGFLHRHSTGTTSVNHVSVRKRKSKLCEIMKSLTNSDLLDRDLILSRASFVEFTQVSVVF